MRFASMLVVVVVLLIAVLANTGNEIGTVLETGMASDRWNLSNPLILVMIAACALLGFLFARGGAE